MMIKAKGKDTVGGLPAKYEPGALEALESLATNANLTALQTVGKFERALTIAAAIRQLDKAITPEMMTDVMALQGTRLGFLTDKDRNGGYDLETVKRCLIEAVLRGLSPAGNEFNIISGNMYATKEGLARLVREYPGLTDLRLDFGVPHGNNSGAIVEAKIGWNLNGKPMQIDRSIPIKVNQGMGVDAILGKAKRKALALVYETSIGSEHTIPEGEVDDVGTPINGAQPRPPKTVITVGESQRENGPQDAKSAPGSTNGADDVPASTIKPKKG